MKRVTVICVLMLALLSARSANDSLFYYDKENLIQQLQELTLLEQQVKEFRVISIDQYAVGDTLYDYVLPKEKPPLGIHPFLWGCCAGGVGILVTYTMTGDPDQVRRSVIGWMVHSVALAGGLITLAILTRRW